MTVRHIMSWNVWKWSSRDDSLKAHMIASVIQHYGVSLVGMMELVADDGGPDFVGTAPAINWTRGTNLGYLTAALGGGWTGRCSGPQRHNPFETYVYAWDTGAFTAAPINVDTLNILDSSDNLRTKSSAFGPFFLPGVVDNNSTQQFMTASAIATNKAADDDLGTWFINNCTNLFLQGLPSNMFYLSAEGWSNLPLPNPPVPTGLVAGTLNNLTFWPCLADQFYGTGYQQFPDWSYRSPFIGFFQFAGTGTPLTLALLHSPGPQDPDCGSAPNILAQVPALTQATNLLIMGDFNIANNHLTDTYPQYGLIADNSTGTMVYSWGELTGEPKLTPFGQVVSGGAGQLNAPRQLTGLTSLGDYPCAPGVDPNDILTNAFDAFFLRIGSTALSLGGDFNIGQSFIVANVIADCADGATKEMRDYRQYAWKYFQYKMVTQGVTIRKNPYYGSQAVSMAKSEAELAHKKKINVLSNLLDVKQINLKKIKIDLASANSPGKITNIMNGAKLKRSLIVSANVTSTATKAAQLKAKATVFGKFESGFASANVPVSLLNTTGTSMDETAAYYFYQVSVLSDHLPIVASLDG